MQRASSIKVVEKMFKEKGRAGEDIDFRRGPPSPPPSPSSVTMLFGETPLFTTTVVSK